MSVCLLLCEGPSVTNSIFVCSKRALSRTELGCTGSRVPLVHLQDLVEQVCHKAQAQTLTFDDVFYVLDDERYAGEYAVASGGVFLPTAHINTSARHSAACLFARRTWRPASCPAQSSGTRSSSLLMLCKTHWLGYHSTGKVCVPCRRSCVPFLLLDHHQGSVTITMWV